MKIGKKASVYGAAALVAALAAAFAGCGRPAPKPATVPGPAVPPAPKAASAAPPAAVPIAPALARPDKVVLAYYPSWVRDKLPAGDIDFSYITHIVHAFARPEADGGLTVPKGFLYPELNAAAHGRGIKVLLGLGGWGNSGGFVGMTANRENRARFISGLVRFLLENAYDGADIDWEWASGEDQKFALSLFIEELSAALNSASPSLLLTMAAPPANYWGRWIDLERIAARLDLVSIMAYDFHGQWSTLSGHNAPLKACGDEAGSVEAAFSYAVGRGVPASRLLVGLPFCGRSFDCGGMGLPFKTCRNRSYSEIIGLPAGEWSFKWDTCAEAPFALRRDGFEVISYDDPRSISLKCQFVKDAGAAGVMIWDLSQDGRPGVPRLLEVIGRSFGVK